MMFIDIVKLSFVDCIIIDFTVSVFKEFACTPISIFVTLSSDINVDVCNNLTLMLYMYYRTWEILAGKNLANHTSKRYWRGKIWLIRT